MEKRLDILASGIHDAKNQLFLAESQVARVEAEQGLDLSDLRYAIEAAAERLARSLTAYRLLRRGAQVALLPVVVADLIDEVALDQRQHLAAGGLILETACTVVDEWSLDRDLVTDMLNNAVQNAARVARSRIRLSAARADGGLVLRVDDDGPGFSPLPPVEGVGLMVARRLAQLHAGGGRHGELQLTNGGPLGGASFVLRLP